ncbi:MAG: hypothetical protein B6U95_09115 [Thermofilum sp. ex4484_82]|nr:MAG: hypothetical protein B6U95_09115 [Thermofilum sp. ex4484_82]OYT36007.1 MAG: hypothetical protein B6U96_09120 [Archaeoglobales archaeon ex4484_92]
MLNVFDKVPRIILIELLKGNNSITSLQRLTGFSYSALHKSIDELENFKDKDGKSKPLVKTVKRGRERICTLTEFGKQMAKWLENISQAVY